MNDPAFTPLPLSDLAGPEFPRGQNPMIAGISEDSRAIRPGYLFAAIPGKRQDGAAFIPAALAAGAVAVLAVPETLVPEGVPVIRDPHPRARLPHLASALFAHAQPPFIAAVTGTSGKTSTVCLAQQIWNLLGQNAASLGTIGLVTSTGSEYGSMTTLAPVALHAKLAALAAGGVSYLAFEASSQGLDQHRPDAVRLRAAAFTGFGRDHLDDHLTIEAYLQAKLRLFSELLPADGIAVLNGDMSAFSPARDICQKRGIRVISYGSQPHCSWRITDHKLTNNGQSFQLVTQSAAYAVTLPLAGRFQAYNVLAAMALVHADETPLEKIIAVLPRLQGVPGRLHYVGAHPCGAAVYVDYAHKPDALEEILNALRAHTPGRLWVVFGCGGNRDSGKRALMGQIAQRLADAVIVTDDNPRHEDAAAIRCAIMANCPKAVEMGDRAQAIHTAIHSLAQGDVLVIAGKGHESGQIVGEQVFPFDDIEIAKSVLAQLSPENTSHAV